MSARSTVQRLLPERLKGVAGPAFGRLMDRLGTPPSGLRAGRDVPRRRADALPAVVVLVPAADEAAVAAAVATLVRVALPLAGVRPVVVLDSPHLAVVRRAGLAADHVPSPADHARRHPDVPYATLLAERLGQLRRDYATQVVVTVPASGWPPDDGQVAALLRPVDQPARRRAWQPLAVAAERLVDRSTSGA